MAEFKTETLSEIHIGSGQILTKNIDFDFDYRKNEDNENDAIIGVFDINKIFKIIGQSNIEKLISFIEKKIKAVLLNLLMIIPVKTSSFHRYQREHFVFMVKTL